MSRLMVATGGSAQSPRQDVLPGHACNFVAMHERPALRAAEEVQKLASGQPGTLPAVLLASYEPPAPVSLVIRAGADHLKKLGTGLTAQVPQVRAVQEGSHGSHFLRGDRAAQPQESTSLPRLGEQPVQGRCLRRLDTPDWRGVQEIAIPSIRLARRRRCDSASAE
jgi:hypothetical protein